MPVWDDASHSRGLSESTREDQGRVWRSRNGPRKATALSPEGVAFEWGRKGQKKALAKIWALLDRCSRVGANSGLMWLDLLGCVWGDGDRVWDLTRTLKKQIAGGIECHMMSGTFHDLETEVNWVSGCHASWCWCQRCPHIFCDVSLSINFNHLWRTGAHLFFMPHQYWQLSECPVSQLPTFCPGKIIVDAFCTLGIITFCLLFSLAQESKGLLILCNTI